MNFYGKQWLIVYKKIIIFFTVFLVNPVFTEQNNKPKENKRFGIGLGLQPVISQDVDLGYKTILTSYKINKYISLNLNIQNTLYYEREEIPHDLIVYPRYIGCPPIEAEYPYNKIFKFCDHFIKNYGKFSWNVFFEFSPDILPSLSPYSIFNYLSLGIGKLPDEQIEVHPNLIIDWEQSSIKQTSLAYIVKNTNRIYIWYSLGQRRKITSNIFLKAEFGGIINMSSNHSAYIYSDNRGFIDPDTQPSIIDLLYYKKVADIKGLKINTLIPQLGIFIEYLF